MKKIFYWRFSRKIEGDFWIFYKRFPWKNFFDQNWEKSNLREFLIKVGTFKTFFDPRYRPPTPVLMESEVKWSEKSEWVFGPLNLFIFGYVKGGVLGNNNIGIKKCTTTFLWVLNLGQVGEILENFQNHPRGESFWKNGV